MMRLMFRSARRHARLATAATATQRPGARALFGTEFSFARCRALPALLAGALLAVAAGRKQVAPLRFDQTCSKAGSPQDLTASLRYAGLGRSEADGGSPPEGSHSSRSSVHAYETVLIRDARPELLAGRPNMDANGIELVQHRTTLASGDFYSDVPKIRTEYYTEICEVVKRTTGADLVLAFHHQVRNSGADAPHEAHIVPVVAGCDGMVHTDYTPRSAAAVLAWQSGLLQASGQDARRYTCSRYMLVNAWRNISDSCAVQNHHLAICDAASVSYKDLVFSDDEVHENYSTETFAEVVQGAAVSRRARPSHRWVYFPAMEHHELVMFKCYDSDLDAPARFAIHGSFVDPSASANSRPRESIEVRTIALFYQ